MMKRIFFGTCIALFSVLVLAGSGYTVGGVDLDSIFAPYHTGWPQAGATGYGVSGTDLNARYAPLSTGSSASPTGYKVGGTDLNAIFAGAGTTGIAISTQPSAVSGSAAAGNPSGTVTSSSTSCTGTHGNSGAYGYSWHLASGSASFTAASSSSTAVTGTVNAGSTNTGSMYCTITDGVTSANTIAVGWSLQNTTPAFIFDGSITAGQIITSNGDGGSSIATGWESAVIGSITGGGVTTTGKTIVGVATTVTTHPGLPSDEGFILNITGFSSDPGATYISELIFNGSVFTGAPASYRYVNGSASWAWSTLPTITDAVTYSVQVAP
jgi:hypothetical protein